MSCLTVLIIILWEKRKNEGAFIQMNMVPQVVIVQQRLIIFIMSQRTLPPRASRGKLPNYRKELPQQPKRERVTSTSLNLEAERKQKEIKFRTQQVTILRHYPFCRAVHYFFDLDTFPRVPGHISYVLDETNPLNNTYPKDQKTIKGSTYGSLLNRNMFGLPYKHSSQPQLKKQVRHKNICSGYLFELEDKKYQNDKMLSTLKVIKVKLQKEQSINFISSIQIIKKDQELYETLNGNLPKKNKISIIDQRLQTLGKKKMNNYLSWQNDDKLYYYHSLNQELHNQILDRKRYLNQEQFLKDLLSHLGSSKNQVQYYYSKEKAASATKVKKSKVANIFWFRGEEKIMKLAAAIVAKKCQSFGQTTYYDIKETVRKVFDIQLLLRNQKNHSYINYQKILKKRCEDIKKSQWKRPSKERPPQLDSFCKNGQLSFKNSTKITGKQYHLILIFHWLCVGLHEIYPIINQYPDLLNLISSDYFMKVFSYLVQAIGSPQVGVMCAAIEALSDSFSKPDPLGTLPLQLSFEYEPKIAVGLLFVEDSLEKTEATDPYMQQIQKITPIKKLKLKKMQFQLLAEQTLQKDQKYQQLLSKLTTKQQKCLKDASSKEDMSRCRHKRTHFEHYINEYIYQFREKGRRICSQSMKPYAEMEEKKRILGECVTFYNKSIDIFMGNVQDKLRSLVDNIDFSQL